MRVCLCVRCPTFPTWDSRSSSSSNSASFCCQSSPPRRDPRSLRSLRPRSRSPPPAAERPPAASRRARRWGPASGSSRCAGPGAGGGTWPSPRCRWRPGFFLPWEKMGGWQSPENGLTIPQYGDLNDLNFWPCIVGWCGMWDWRWCLLSGKTRKTIWKDHSFPSKMIHFPGGFSEQKWDGVAKRWWWWWVDHGWT